MAYFVKNSVLKEHQLLKLSILLLIAVRFALAIYYPVFSDANMYFYQAKQMASSPSLIINPEISYFPPLLFIIGAFVYTIIGEVGLKLIAPFFGAVAIYYTYRLGKDLFGKKVGLYGAVFLGIIPSHIYFSSMGYMDSLVTGLSIAFIYYFYRADTLQKMMFAGIIAGLTGISKISGLVVFLFIGVYFLIIGVVDLYNNKGKDISNLFKKCVIIGFIGMLIITPYYLRNFVLFENVFFPDGKSIHYARTFDSDVFYTNYSSTMELGYKSSFLGNVNMFGYISDVFTDFWGLPTRAFNISFVPDVFIYIFILFGMVVSIFYLFGIWNGFKNKNFLLIYIWLITWLFLIILQPLEFIGWGFRRLLPIAPFISLLAGYQFSMINKNALKKISYIIIIFSIIIFPISQIGKAIYAKSWFDTYSDSLEYLKTLPEESIVLTPYEEQTIYYSEKKTMFLNNLKLDAFNLTTLKKYNITHVVRTESFIFFNLSGHNNVIDQMARNGGLSLLWESRYVKIYKIES